MSTFADHTTGAHAGDDTTDGLPSRRSRTETKPSFKTTELAAYVLTVLGVLIASAVVDQNEDGQGFGAERAWLYVTLLTIGYLVSRGLAKSGSTARDDSARH
jgi:hypothetical protein